MSYDLHDGTRVDAVDELERVTRFVYGQTFARYDRDAFEEFLRPLEIRLESNGIPRHVFEEKLCLDAGCGGGRGTILMAKSGAKQVTAFDLADQNCSTTRQRAEEYGLGNITVRNGSLLEIPYDDESFDVVWCNGVVHHTVDPGRALCEVSRVVRRGGWMWLYLYGSGGIYWFFVDFVRDWLRDVSIQETLAVLSSADVSIGRIAEFIDDWYVPMLKRYRHQDVAPILGELGFKVTNPLSGGVPYDTSVNRNDREPDKCLGEGDLRYWIRKDTHHVRNLELPDVTGKGSQYGESAGVARFSTLFQDVSREVDELSQRLACSPNAFRILTCARLQTRLRDLLPTRPFDLASFGSDVQDQVNLISSLPRPTSVTG